MTRRLPHTSARRPTNGAASATAAVVAVTVRLTWKWLAPKTSWNNGSSGWVAYRLGKAAQPANRTGARGGTLVKFDCVPLRGGLVGAAGNGRFGRLKSDLRVRAVAEGFGGRAAAPAQRER